MFVATVNPKSGGLSGAASPEDSTVVAYLIDSVTGQILHRVTHPRMQGPVHAVLARIGLSITTSIFVIINMRCP
ncbi:hypothetical protein BDL97_15G099000 [Sphagnum fallax]|nr:hypothetical protein BDL97_15G099000 [Sphagnum fallax]